MSAFNETAQSNNPSCQSETDQNSEQFKKSCSSSINNNNKSNNYNNNNNISHFSDFEDSDWKSSNDFICELIRKQIENENKLKSDISTLNSRAMSHIYEKLDRGHNQVFDYKFKEYLLSIGYDKENTNQLINYLLDSFDGSLDLDDLKHFFGNFSTSNWVYKSDMHLQRLLNCSLLPGFLDCFVSDDYNYDLLWQKLYKFLISNRLPSEVINEPYIENRILVTSLRRKMLLEIGKNLSEENTKNKSICVDQQCFSNIKVCCSREKIHGLIDGKSHTYWQTSNTEKCENHWILITLKENIKLTSLTLNSIGNKNDEILKSVIIEVRAGSSNKFENVISKCDYNLTINNDYVLCSCFPNEQNISYLKIVFRRNSEKNIWGKNSDQIKVKSLKLIGKREAAKSPRITVQDASICWYFEMLSAIAIMQSQIIPSLHSKILQISKTALQNMPPLSLTSEAKNTFLSPYVLEKVDKFFNNFLELTATNSEEKSEAILVYLSFNLARGHLQAILNSLYIILENIDIKYEYLDLISKIDEASQANLRKTAQPISYKFFKIDSNSPKSNEFLNENEIVNSYSEEISEFSLEPYNKSTPKTSESANEKLFTSYNMLLGVDQNITVTNVNFKIKLESIGIKGAVVVSIFNDKKPNLHDFESFDNFDQEKFNQFIEEKKNNKSTNNEFELNYYEFYDNQIDILLELPIHHLTKFVLIKLLRPRENSPKVINITNVKVLGCVHNTFELYDDLKMYSASRNVKGNSPAILINAVLWFLCQLAEQHKESDKKNDDLPKFLNFENFQIVDLWKIYEKAFEIESKIPNNEAISNQNNSFYINIKIPVLILLYELVNCNEIKNNTENIGKNQSYQNIFESLCEIIDNQKNDKTVENKSAVNLDNILERISKEILKNGLLVFFPLEDERRECFLNMIEKNTQVLNNSELIEFKNEMISLKSENKLTCKFTRSLQQPSTKLLFEAFCNLFCSNKSNLIQHLNKDTNMFEDESYSLKTLNLLEKIIELSLNLGDYNSQSSSSKLQIKDRLITPLHDLLNSIQSRILYSIIEQLNSIVNIAKNNEQSLPKMKAYSLKQNIYKFIVNYTKLLLNYSQKVVNTLNSSQNSFETIIPKMKNFFNKIIYNYILWITEIFGKLDIITCTQLADYLVEFNKVISGLDKFLASETSRSSETEKTLKTWTFSSKTRSTITDLGIEYSFPLANKFIIEFDPSSSLVTTENSESMTYSFSDCNERIHLFSGTIGSTSWKEKMEIKSNSYIIFNVRSNKDLKLSSQFFLKFTVTAVGFDKVMSKVSLRDVFESITSLLGSHLARAYNERYGINYSELLVYSLENNSEATEIKESKVEPCCKSSCPRSSSYQHQTSCNEASTSLNSHLENDSNAFFMSNYNSHIYKVLLRGGFNQINNYLYERSFDNNDTNSLLNEKDTKLLEFLNKLVNYLTNLLYDNGLDDDTKHSEVREFLLVYDKNFSSNKNSLAYAKIKMGGLNTSELVLRIFAVLIWHNPSIKFSDIFYLENGKLAPIYNEQINQAFKAAESTRMYIIEQQQQYKLKHMNSSEQKTLIDILTEKVLYLLKFERLVQSSLTNQFLQNKFNESNKIEGGLMGQGGSCMLNSVSMKKRRTRFPKHDSIESYNIVFEFIFSKDINDLNLLTKILNIKRTSSVLIKRNLDSAIKFIESIIHNQNESPCTSAENEPVSTTKKRLESILIYLSCFFMTSSIPASKMFENLNKSEKQTPLLFPPSLKFNFKHYLENLHGCGLVAEENIRKSYYNLVSLLLNYSYRLSLVVDNSVKNLCIRFNSYLINLLDIVWELEDYEYVYTLNIVEFLIKSSVKSLPIAYYKEENNLTNSQVLEKVFSLSRETYNELYSNKNKSQAANDKNGLAKSSKLTSLEEEHDEIYEDDDGWKTVTWEKTESGKKMVVEPDLKEDSMAKNTTTKEDDDESFDLKIFPKLYLKVFQTNTSTSASTGSASKGTFFDTDSLIKCLTGDIKSYEQYEKFIVARYMFWKYFSQLKTNFYCNSCEVVLYGYRYVCLECYDHCLCLNCFSKSIINSENDSSSSSSSSNKNKNQFNKFNSNNHQPSHRLLLLDHICNQCASLIIGKRYSCHECADYDLCLSCYKKHEKGEANSISSMLFENNTQKFNNKNHSSDHKFIYHEPVIIMARSDQIIDTQLYLYLHSQFLFTILTLKLSTLLSLIQQKDCQSYFSNKDLDENSCHKYAKHLHNNCLKSILFMISKTSNIGQSLENNEFIDKLKLYSIYTQENLVGLLESVIKASRNILSSTDTSLEIDKVHEDILKETKPKISQYEPTNSISVSELIKFVLNILQKDSEYQFDETVYIMFINILKSLLLISEPNKVDNISKNYLKSEKSSNYTLELILEFINEYMNFNRISIASNYLNLIYALNQNKLWNSCVVDFMRQIFDNLLDIIKCKHEDQIEQDKLMNFIYALNCAPILILSGHWIEYKNESKYDGAGILKSKYDYKISLTKLFYPDSYPNSHYICTIEPESRRVIYLKNQKYGYDFKKADESRLKFKTTLELDKINVKSLVCVLNLLLSKYKLKDSSEKPDEPVSSELSKPNDAVELTPRVQMFYHELNHIKKKKNFHKSFQQLNPNSSIFILCIITLIKKYIMKRCAVNGTNSEEDDDCKNEDDLELADLIDSELLSYVSKIAFLNTNMNPYWKLEHLNHFFGSLLLTEGFNNLKQSFDMNQEFLNPISVNEISSTDKSSTGKLAVKSEPNAITPVTSSSNLSSNTAATQDAPNNKQLTTIMKKITKDTELDDFKLNNNAVLGVCNDASNFLFSFDDPNKFSDPNKSSELTPDKRYKFSLKILEDCAIKLSKYDSSIFLKSNSSANASLSPKIAKASSTNATSSSTSNPAPNKTNKNQLTPLTHAIKLVSSAASVLSCREILILFINWFLKLKEQSKKKKDSQFSIIHLNCDTEYEFLQLLDILYYTDNSQKYKLFVKNLVRTFCIDCETADSSQVTTKSEMNSKVVIKIIMMACDFMLPEFKLIKKVSWSSDEKRENDFGFVRGRLNPELLTEENLSFSSSTLYAKLYSILVGAGAINTTSTNTFPAQPSLNKNAESDPSSSKPADIEKLSVTDPTLLIVFDMNKNQQQNNINNIAAMTKNKKFKLKKFYTKSKRDAKLKNNKYFLTDDFDESNNNKDDDDTESLDSLNLADLDAKTKPGKFSNSDGGIFNKRAKLLASRNEIDDDDDENDEDVDDDNNDTQCDNSVNHAESKLSGKNKTNNSSKKCSINFQVIGKRNNSQSNYDSNTDDYDIDDNDDDNDDVDDEDADDSTSSTEIDYDVDNPNEDSDRKSEDEYSGDDWYGDSHNNINNNYNSYSDSDEEKSRKLSFKLPLDSIENSPYLAIQNQKMLKWKFSRRDDSDWTVDTCSFKIYSTLSKNFESAYHLLDELIEQLNESKLISLNELWIYLIKIACIQSFLKRLKILNLLIRIIQKVYSSDSVQKSFINLFALRPLKNLQYTLESSYKEDRNLSRALYELFFFAEKLAIKWSVETEFRAHMRERNEFIEKMCEASFFINSILNSLNMNENTGFIDSAKVKSKLENINLTETKINSKSNKSVKSKNTKKRPMFDLDESSDTDGANDYDEDNEEDEDDDDYNDNNDFDDEDDNEDKSYKDENLSNNNEDCDSFYG